MALTRRRRVVAAVGVIADKNVVAVIVIFICITT
jgi:hypothetical protein